MAGCRDGGLAVWNVSGDKVASKPAVHKLGLPTSICAVAASPVHADEVRTTALVMHHKLAFIRDAVNLNTRHCMECRPQVTEQISASH